MQVLLPIAAPGQFGPALRRAGETAQMWRPQDMFRIMIRMSHDVVSMVMQQGDEERHSECIYGDANNM